MTGAGSNGSGAQTPVDAVAIVGMAGRFPGAANVRDFWKNLRTGTVSVTRFAPGDLEDAFDERTRSSPDFVAARPILEDVDLFDADFFGVYGREAELMDPQHRVFLEIAWEALEAAGLDPQRHDGPIGVFAGASMPTYFLNNICVDREAVAEFTSNYQLDGFPTLLGALPDALATRIAYKLDLRGPAITVQSACSTSLLAVSQACQSLLMYQCDAALAGGVSITFPQKRGYLYQDGGMGARDGVCRPFDKDAAGTIFGSGAGVVVLKRLEDALAAGDLIHAVIRGSAVNNDGASKIGFTAPSAEGQAGAIAAALAAADVDPASIGYVELHGTATPLGDPIEFQGLRTAFGECDGRRNFCVLGSAKGNVGHLDAAAGVTGLIKAALSLHHEEIPPLAGFTSPNPRINLADSPFRIESGPVSWPRGGIPRRAGVSSFGVGGTNVHVILEEAPLVGDASGSPDACVTAGPLVLPLSARTDIALSAVASRLADHLVREPALALTDIAHTLQNGRRAFNQRGAVIAQNRDDALSKLRDFGQSARRGAADHQPPVIFMFPGQGSQYPGMGKPLYESESVFREAIDRGAEILKPLLNLDIRELMYAGAPGEDDTPHPVRSTVFAQPALFLTQYALARLWMARGVRPSGMIGHSVGEFVAACLADVMSFEDALGLVAARASLMQSAPPGTMLAVRASEESLRARLIAGVDIAAVNAPSLCVVSGPFEAIGEMERQLGSADIQHRRLHTSHAFHSAMMDTVVEQLAARAASITFREPALPYVSCVTGQWATLETVGSGDYWARHCRAAVRFADGLATVVAGRKPILLEVGPGRTLSTFAAQGLPRDGHVAIVTSLPEFAEALSDQRIMADATARLWTHGVAIDWTGLERGGRRVELPTYPFERKRYWIEAPASSPRDRHPPLASRHTPERPSPLASTQRDAVITAPELAAAATPSPDDRVANLSAEIAGIIESLSGETVARADWNTSYLELGFDSLFLGQVAQRVQRRYAVKVTFRQLLGDYPSVLALAKRLDAQLPSAAPQQAPLTSVNGAIQTPQSPSTPVEIIAGDADLAATFQVQLAAMQTLIDRQLDVLRTRDGPVPGATTQPPPPVPYHPAPANDETANDEPSRFRMFRKDAPGAALTAAQRDFVRDFTERASSRMAGSKAYAAENRAHLADPRSVSGFRSEWKDAIFPIVCSRAKGSKLWDIDGNEYVDLVNGYGQTAFGHSPDFVVEAISEQLHKGFPIGPQSDIAGDVARRIAAMVGLERVTFCNTGSEAVMAAMRVARAVTGRDRVAVFANDYHGQFDEVLVKGGRRGSPPRAFPISAGIPAESVSNVVVLGYGEADSLSWIRENADSLAAVIVEPVQSRHPELRPVAFLKELREITAANGVAYVFDEVVTGFRTHPGGAQALFGIRADLAAYGKVIGGGMPIGVLAGRPAFMDALDGGPWNYGDDSVPEIAPIFFAGTFVRHPLVIAAARAVLTHLENEGPGLQESLARRTAGLVDRINADLARRSLRSRAETFSSWFMLNLAPEDSLASLFYPYVRLLGVNIQEGFPCFLTTAHDAADLARIERAFSIALDALQGAGILTGRDTVPQPVVTAGAAASIEPGQPQLALPDSVPLTETQKEVWLSAQLGDAASCAFNESFRVDLEGPLAVDRLLAALNEVIARHDSLRGCFGLTGETMTVLPEVRLDPDLRDLTAGPDPRAELNALLDKDARTPFDLAAGPLVRAFIARLSPTTHVLVFTAHHIVFDGWSSNVLLSELSAIYAARLKCRPSDLPAAPQYRTYALDQAARPALAETRAFWLDQFKTVPDLPDMPADRARPERRSFSGATRSGQIDGDLLRRVKKAGAKLGCTAFATLFTAFQVMIGKLAQSNDVVVAVPTAGQSLLDDPALVGHCVNLLPIRVACDPDASLADHLSRVKTSLLRAFDHQDYTFGTLVRELRTPRSANRLPLTEIQFNLETFGASLGFEGLSARVQPNPKAFANFDIFFNVIESPDGLRIDCDFNTDVFDAATIDRWMGHYRVLLEAIAAGATQPIRSVSMMTTEERVWLTKTLNATDADLPECLVSDLFAVRSRQTPDAVAVRSGDRALTYQELEARANRLARYLDRHLITPGRVAIALDRSLDMVSGLLAVMKAGHAYVPLDVDHPLARLRLMIEEADIAAMICDSDAMEALAPSGVAVIRIDRMSAMIDAEDPSPLAAGRGEGDAAAYVIFTSGSTGRPKGVEVSHRAVVNLLVSMARRPGFKASDRIVAVTTLTFDIAGLELFLPLTTGGEVVIASRDDVRSGFGLVELIARSKPTMLQATPSLWRLLLEAGFRPGPAIRMLCGGNAWNGPDADALRAGGGELWNVYGPTETTIWSTLGRVGEGRVTIGEPIANTQVHILDRHDELCVVGAPGLLHIGGAGLAEGYFGQPDLTAAAFRMVNIDGRARHRLYNTGDLARRLADGSIEVLGRADQQIKFRGFRIELEEVEAVIRAVPGVAAAAVALRTGPSGDPRLVGYYSAAADAAPTVAELAAASAARLPDYMRPTAWLSLASLPLTANGKLDRKALPDVGAKAIAARDIVAPRSEMETKLAAIWSEVLGLADIGVTDSLFALGADSLHLFRIAARMIDRGIPLQARHLLQHPSIADLAPIAEAAARSDVDPAVPSLVAFRGGGRRKLAST